MHLCSHNLRIGIFSDPTIVSVMGEVYNRIIFSKIHSNCSVWLISALTGRSVGRNLTWQDMLRNNLFDLVMVKARLGTGNDLIEETTVTGKTTYQAALFLKPLSQKLDFSNFLISNLWLLAFIILGYFLVAAVTTILPILTHANGRSPLKSLKLILFRAPFMDHNQLPRVHLRLIFLFFNLFLFLNLKFLGCAIKTDKVTVPTDEIVDSTAKLLDTSKTLTFNPINLFWIKTAPKGHLLQKLSEKDYLVVDGLKSLTRLKTTGLNRFVIFSEQIRAFYFMSILSQHAKNSGSVAFSKTNHYYESFSTFRMRRSLDEERKRFINSRLGASFECGILLFLYTEIIELFKLRVQRNVEFYESLDDFVSDISQKVSPNVTLYNVQNLFLYFGSFLILVLLVYVIDIFLFKQLKRINRKLVRCFANLLTGSERRAVAF